MNTKAEKVNINDLLKITLEFKDYAMILFRPDGKIDFWNQGATVLYGYSLNEMIDQSIFDLYKELPSVEEQKAHLKQALLNGRVEYNHWEKRKDNTLFYANIIIVSFHNADGSVKGLAKVLRDISIYKNLEIENALLKAGLEEKVKQRTRELEVVNKELEAFSYSVSHDLRTPLRAVIGYSNMLKEDYETSLDNEANRIINNIIDNAKMMGQLIDDLLTFSKMSRLEVVNQSIDMKNLAIGCWQDLLQSEARSGINFLIRDLPNCSGDGSMLRQVWYNLLSNALKYSSKNDNPKIVVGFTESEDWYCYYVQDNGVGFDMKYAGKLFGVFQRLHRQDEFEGTGLGLALVKRIISKHRGEIWTNASKDAGATFYFTIPKKIHNEQ